MRKGVREGVVGGEGGGYRGYEGRRGDRCHKRRKKGRLFNDIGGLHLGKS